LSVKAFRDWFKKRCREARREDRSAHRLRKLGAQRCAEAGASEHQLMACLEGEPRPARRGGGFVGGTERERTGARTGNAVAINSARKSNKMSAVASGATIRPKLSTAFFGSGVPKGIRTPVTAVKGGYLNDFRTAANVCEQRYINPLCGKRPRLFARVPP
jgi:hypothetical protein